VIQHFIFLKRDKFPPIHDEFRCFELSIGYLDDFEKSPFIFLKSSITEVIPPLYRLLPLPFYMLFGENIDILGTINIFWLILLIISVYLLGKQLLNPNFGLIAVIILLGFPAIIGYSRICYYPIALTACVALSYYFLIRSNFFENKKFCYLWGLSCIIGFLIHPYFLYYILPGIIILFLNIRTKEQRLNFLKVFLLIFLSSGFWYISVLIYPPARINFLNLVKPTFAGSQPMTNIIKNYFSPNGLLEFQIFPYYWIFVLSSIYLISKIVYLSYIYAWVSLSFILVLFHPSQNVVPRLLLPILPGIAIIITCFSSRLGKKIKFRFLIMIFLILSLSPYIRLKYMKEDPLETYFYIGKVFPMLEIKHIDKIADLIGEDNIIGFISNNLADPNPFITEAIIYKSTVCKRNTFWNLSDIIERRINYFEFIDRCNYILYIKSNYKSDFPGYRKEQLIKLQNEFKKKRNEFILIKQVNTGYGVIEIFKHIK
jgi:hypothetical protein